MRSCLLTCASWLRCSFLLIGVLAALSLSPGLCSKARAYSFLRLWSFTGRADGAYPLGGVIADSRGNLYGTTQAGGDAKGAGTVFKIAPGHVLETLYTFCQKSHCTDGEAPDAGLVMDALGNLYGTTSAGGAHGGGEVFELTNAGVERVLYSFCSLKNCADGHTPLAGLIMDRFGALYGTTQQGGATNGGIVFQLGFTPAKGVWVETVLYSFCPKGAGSGCPDGQAPVAGLVMDAAGSLYGTTQLGGNTHFSTAGGGVVFVVNPNLPSARSESVLYRFCALAGCADGNQPKAGVILDKTGNLFGTTWTGGNSKFVGNTVGVVFEITAPRRAEKLLYTFCSRSGCADGYGSEAGLSIDAAGSLYGTTTTGGGISSQAGVVFRLTGRVESVLYSFLTRPNGSPGFPVAGVIADKIGNLYGTASQSSGNGFGAVFELKK